MRPEPKAGASAALRRLRVHITLLVCSTLLVAMAAFVAAILLVDARSAAARLDSELRGDASRGAALVYVDKGRVRLDGLTDDLVSTRDLAVVTRGTGSPVPLLVLGDVPVDAVLPVAGDAFVDEGERGTFAWVDRGGERVRAVAMPWFDEDRIGGAVVVVEPQHVGRSPMLLPAAAGAVIVVLLLAAATWRSAGRVLVPAARAMDEREAFLASAAHELRAPLARLRVGAEALAHAVGTGGPAAGSARRLVSVADSAGHVVANLLLRTRVDGHLVHVERRPVRLDELVSESEYLADSVVVDTDGPVTVSGDAALLRHLLVNLVDNALRHGRVGEEVPTVTVVVRHVSGSAVLTVADDGPGFAADPGGPAPRPYTEGGSTGLGLPLVRWIAAEHGATVRLSNGAGGLGARAEVTFPALGSERLRRRGRGRRDRVHLGR